MTGNSQAMLTLHPAMSQDSSGWQRMDHCESRALFYHQTHGYSGSSGVFEVWSWMIFQPSGKRRSTRVKRPSRG